MKIMQDGEGFSASWMLEKVEITDTRTERTWTFPCNGWLDAGKPNTLRVSDDGGSNSPLKRNDSNHAKKGLSKLKDMVAPTAHEDPQPGARSVRAKIRAKSWAGPKLTRRRMSEMEELLASTAKLQRRGSTPASTDDGSQGAQELDLLGNPIVTQPKGDYGYR